MLMVWFFVITFATGGTQVQKGFTDAVACNVARDFMVLGLAQQAEIRQDPLRPDPETVTVTDCAFGEPPG